MDISEQVEHWRRGADADWRVGIHLVSIRKLRHGLFFMHLAMEKLLKAHVCQRSQRYAPRIHVLPKLADMAELELTPEHRDFLDRFDRFNIAGRYPDDQLLRMPRPAEARQLVVTAREIYRCLREKL